MAKSSQLSLFPDAARPPTLREVADAVREAGIDALPDARRRADDARYQEIVVRSALTEAKGMPFRWALNPYRGCTHACEYCYARKYQRHLELDAGDQFSTMIFVKINLALVLAKELAKPGWTRERVAVGTATDPYQPIEGHYRLTRQALDVLLAARTPFSIVTKGPMVVRDLDILTRATAGAGCKVFLSIPSVDEDAWQHLEPGTASPQQRLRAARTLREAGVDAGVLMMPLVPGVTTTRASIQRTVDAIAEAGVPLSGANVARLDPGVREHFFGFLERSYPALLEGYQRLYQTAHASASYTAHVDAAVRAARKASGGPAAPESAPRSADASRTATAGPRPRTG